MAKQITLEEIQSLDHSKLSNMLYEMIDTNEELYDRLEKMMLSSNPKELVKSIKKDISSIKRGRKFIRYDASFHLSKQIWAIVENIESFLYMEGHSVEAAALLKELMLTDTKVYDRTDDSAGVVSDAYEYAAEVWGKCSVDMDEDVIYSDIQELLVSDDYGVREILSDELPGTVLEKIYNEYYATFDRYLDDEGYGEYKAMSILHKCAHLMQSPKHYIKASMLKSKKLDDGELLDIAKEYKYIDDVSNVIATLEKIEYLPRHKLGTLFEMKIWAYDKQGNVTDKVAAYKEFYEKTKEADVLLKYLELLEDETLKLQEKEKALKEVQEYDFAQAIRFYKTLNEKELCAKYIVDKENELKTSSLHTAELKALLKWLRNDHPQETILLLRDLCESSLATKQSKYYGSSIWALGEMLNIEEENDTLSWGIEENSEYIDRLLKEHKQKRRFIEMFHSEFE